MIVGVGAWVLRQACLDRGLWVKQGLPAPRIAVNVSSVQLRQPEFVTLFRNALMRATGGSPTGGALDAGIDVEVTESVFVDSAEATLKKLRALRALGVEIAIDDFGTGYPSLRYLAKMPLNSLKIAVPSSPTCWTIRAP